MIHPVEDIDKKIYNNLSAQISAMRSIVVPHLRQRNRTLYWATHYHVNTRLQPMTFKDLPYLLSLYMIIDSTPFMVVEKSVQCGMSELFIIQSHIEAGERAMTVMYVLPKYELRNRFVNNRIYKLHKRAPAYGRFIAAAETKVHRTSLMHFGSGTLAYVGSNVSDEFVEIPVDSAYVDEKDRCNLPNLLLLPDRLTASPYKYQREIGNPTVEGFGIDERYAQSSRGVWKIKCSGCGVWFSPDFFSHVVREVGSNMYAPRDESVDPDPQSGSEMGLIHDCGATVNRLQNGEWVHEFPGREWKGFRVGKVFSKFTTLRLLYRKWATSVGNDLKTQIFYNSDLGLPFSSKGAKITRGMLNDCRQNYEWPPRQVGNDKVRIMGVDVGESLHVILRERFRSPDGICLRLLGVWVLPGFNLLGQLIREWKPRAVVIDAMPEIHKVADLKDDFDCVWSSLFQEGAGDLVRHKDKREVRQDRTAILDYVRQAVELKRYINPMQAESLAEGSYYSHMEAPTRILEANEDRPEKSRFVWKEGSRPDHFFLAEAYCMQAGMLMPEHGIFDFFEQESKALTGHARIQEVRGSNLSDSERQKIADMSHMTPEVFLANRQAAVLPSKIAPKVDDEKIRDTIGFMFKSQGYVDAELCAQIAREHVEDVFRVLTILEYHESRIKGQFVK